MKTTLKHSKVGTKADGETATEKVQYNSEDVNNEDDKDSNDKNSDEEDQKSSYFYGCV